jgi:hypothetical protein
MNTLKTFEAFFTKEAQEDTTKDLNIIEKKTDGTISDDEESREEDLLASAEAAIDDLIATIKKEANDIGGSFRSPGIESRVGKLLKEKLVKAKLIR